MHCLNCGREIYWNIPGVPPPPFCHDRCAAKFAREYVEQRLAWDEDQQLWLPRDPIHRDEVLGSLTFEVADLTGVTLTEE